MASESVKPFLAALLGVLWAFLSVEFIQAFQGGVAGQERQGRGDGDKGFQPSGPPFVHQQEAADDYGYCNGRAAGT